MIVIQYKNCYSGLITKKSLSGEGVFFLLLLPWKQTTIKRIFLLLSLKTYDSKDGITYSDRYFNLTATYHHIWKFQHPLHPF